ncbi:hypothetical protein WSM22_31660 [Cytophagales bacterium WSM2-2]|nr:hypothetical protein WSM22_31660 [Cytophagales bacterium WSM2-2]
MRQYRVSDGLPSDIIKSCVQDSLGYLWIATDDGLVKYDGIKFTHYREALHSSYVKGFIVTRKGRLLVFGDLDLVEIKNLGDTVLFSTVKEVSRSSKSDALTYPKQVYEDSQETLWVSESQSVVRLQGNSLKRYEFSLANRTPQFLRSFSFFEDRKKNLYVSSFQGNIFKLNIATDAFEEEKIKLPFGIEYLSSDGNELLAGALGGLYRVTLPEEGGLGNVEQVFSIPQVSYVAALAGEKYFIATRASTHYIADLKKKTFTPIGFPITSINNVYRSGENDLWISGNDGLLVMKEKLIKSATKNISRFIEACTEDPSSGKMFFSSASTMYSFDPAQDKIEKLLDMPDGYFQSLLFTDEGIWAANAFTLLLYKDGIRKKWDFSDVSLGQKTNFVTDIIKDSKGNIWFAQPGNPNALWLDTKRNLHQEKIALAEEGSVNLIREGKDGLYIGSTGKKAYLFFKANEDSIFRNISVPVQFKTQGDFNVTGIAITGSIVWLATSEGLLKFDHKTIERVDLGGIFTGLTTKSVKVYRQNQLLFTNAYGLILYNPSTGDYNLFNEGSGLLSNTITTRGLFIDRNQNVWIGTSKGLCYTTHPLTTSEKTPIPRFVETRANGKKMRLSADKEIPFGSFISLGISSITFPEKEIIFQYRLNNEKGWHPVNGSELNFSDLGSGNFALEVRAKKNGPYAWSDSATLAFQIAKPFWMTPWFILLFFIATGSLILVTVIGVNRWNRKQNHVLELLIDERTTALRAANEELSQRNSELDRFVYSASHDLSAPLKSILGLISVAKMDNPSPMMDRYLDLMKTSVIKLDSFIKDIISYSRNARLEIKKEKIAFTPMVESIWADLQFMPEVNQLKFEIDDQLRSPLLSDEIRLKIIFNNLLSNAIKFRRLDHDPYIKVMARETPGYFEFTVCDNGVGISTEYKEKIFNMFFRANERVQGSGLGLYILKETLSRLKGTVTVESALGEGSQFIILLPK